MSTITLWNILNNNVPNSKINRGIEIPMIQRDYAQGRKDGKANEIRKIFLSKIKSAIDSVINHDSPPLELDFIYGYLESEYFIPLDGQQRLTTLYLLHWYFAFKEEKLASFRTPFSRFTYQTRQSSGDFLKKLNEGFNQFDHNEIFSGKHSFETLIKDKNWYYVNWKYDLTIQSAICMLDEIHQTFGDSVIELADITREDKPCIVFNYLDIRDFGLSDDLYIKMNARGKPLTNFENLKAELGRFIELSDFNNKYNYSIPHSSGNKFVNVETYFVTKIDTSWTDFFWKLRNKETNEFDDKLLNLLAFISLSQIAKVDVSKFEVFIKSLEQGEGELSYYSFMSQGLLNEASIIFYIDVLDTLVSNDTIIKQYLSDQTFFDKGAIIANASGILTKPTYEQRVIFYAMFSFLVRNRNVLEETELKKWDRLIRNLVSNRNTLYNSAKDFGESLTAIDFILENYDGDIYQVFLDKDVTGFDSQQIKEEKLKIELLRSSDNWERFIYEAECHPYLQGQIIFLLAFSGVYDKYLDGQLGIAVRDEEAALVSATGYFEKFKKTFKDTGLREFKDELFRRALLTKGDYLLYSTNWSLLIDNHRDISWKRLLKETGNKTTEYFQNRCPFLKELFDDINLKEIEGSLEAIIKANVCDDWRKDFVEHPILMKLSREKYLKFYDHDDDIYVLRKSKYNKFEDPEVNSILVKEALKKKGFAADEIKMGYIESLNQYGISGIGNRKPKITYNHDGSKRYYVKHHGREDQYFNRRSQVINYIVDNF